DRGMETSLMQAKAMRKWQAIALAAGTALVLTWANLSAARAQTPTFADALNAPLDSLLNGGELATDIATGGVYLDGRRVFVITAPSASSLEGGDQAARSPIQQRTNIVERRLRELARLPFDPTTLRARVDRDPTTNALVMTLRATSDTGQSLNEYVMTVTPSDQQLYGINFDDLNRSVEGALRLSQREHQSGYLARQGAIALGLVLGAGGLNWAIERYLRQLQRHYEAANSELEELEESLAAIAIPPTTDEAESLEPEQAEAAVREVAIKQQLEREQKRRRLFDFQRQLLFLFQATIWIAVFLGVIGLFPQTRGLQTFIFQDLGAGIARVIPIAIGTYAIVRLSEYVIDKVLAALSRERFLLPEASLRLAKRIDTFSGVLKGTVAALLVGVGTLTTLSVLGVNVGPILAGAGILSLGISFGSQSLVKDVINGFFILLEDQFSVGDVIVAGGSAGLVEAMNLRITQLRSADGNLITIPNSAIVTVENLTKEWSRANLGIDVAYDTDLNRAIALITQVAETMRCDRHWRDAIPEPAQVLGVDAFGENSITIRVWIKTQPLQQWAVSREFRLRLKQAFDEAGISIPFPQRSIWFQTPLRTQPSDPEYLRAQLEAAQLTKRSPLEDSR
ncbi:MAG: mechanosensitive ion channel family protein, partial [Cyanobacteria bacterium J06639_1]